MMPAQMIYPPCLITDDGRRRVGVEIEFAGLSCERAAGLVGELFGGGLERVDPHFFKVVDTRFGTVEVALDSQYVHPDEPQTAADDANSTWDDITRGVRNGLTSVLGDVASLWLPVEIVSPPLPLEHLPEFNAIVAALRAAGAEGSKDGLVYAFATQFNPEAPSLTATSMVAHLKAFLVLNDELRQAIDVDILRRSLPFADPFPRAYARKVVDPDYQPDLAQLVEDYIDANPTRNRDLDMLPLFAHVAPERVFARIDDGRVRGRPTYHYRLPDTRLSDPDWDLIVEWNRWVEVEQLAADARALRFLGSAFLADEEGRRHDALPKAIDTWRAEKTAAP